MTHDEWADAERAKLQAAAVEAEHLAAERAAADPLLAWLNNAPTGDIATGARIAAALTVVLDLHRPFRPTRKGYEHLVICDDCNQDWPCFTRQDIAEALGVTL